MLISDWSSDVCSSDLRNVSRRPIFRHKLGPISVRSWPVFSGKSLMSREAEYHKADNIFRPVALQRLTRCGESHAGSRPTTPMKAPRRLPWLPRRGALRGRLSPVARSEEHTSELQSLMRIYYAVYCSKK